MKTRIYAARAGARGRPAVHSSSGPRQAIRRSPEGAEIHRILQGPEATAGPRVQSYIGGLEGRGQALAPAVRADMEPRFGADFGAVRVHTDNDAADSARALNAQAYTYGNQLVFGAGRYAPDTAAGRRLIAHELAHTVQQNTGRAAPVVQRVVDGDVTKITVSETWARDLNNSELPAQIALVEKQVKGLKSGTPEHGRAKDNLKVLKAEQARRAVPLPKAAAPQKGEKPAGTIKSTDTGTEEKLYSSRVTGGLWWFNGATPTLAALYPSEADLDISSAGAGQFDCVVAKGADKLGLVTGGAVASTLSAKDLKLLKVRAIGASQGQNDVELKISFTAPGAKQATVTTLLMEVRAPVRLELLRIEDHASGKHGYRTEFSLRLFDNFGVPVPYLDVNEDFTAGKVEAGVSQHWTEVLKQRHKGDTITAGNAVFTDQYSSAVAGGAPPKDMAPVPVPPQKPLGQTLVARFDHWWYAGTKTTGKGVKVSAHQGLLFTDHGEYVKLRSPP